MKNTQKHININKKKNKKISRKKITKIKKMRGGDNKKFTVETDTLKNLLTQIIQKRNKTENSFNPHSIIEQLKNQEKLIKIYVLNKTNGNNFLKFSLLDKKKIKKDFGDYLLTDTDLPLIFEYLENDIKLDSKIVEGDNHIYLVILNNDLFKKSKALRQPSAPSASSGTSVSSYPSTSSVSSVHRASSGTSTSSTSSAPSAPSVSSSSTTSTTSTTSKTPVQSNNSSSNLESLNSPSFIKIAQMLRIGIPLAWEIKTILGLTLSECISIANSFKEGGNKLIDGKIVQKIFEDDTKQAMSKEEFISEIHSMIQNKMTNPEIITERDRIILNKILKLSNNKKIKQLMIGNGFITADKFEAIKGILKEAASEITKTVNGKDGPVKAADNGNAVANASPTIANHNNSANPTIPAIANASPAIANASPAIANHNNAAIPAVANASPAIANHNNAAIPAVANASPTIANHNNAAIPAVANPNGNVANPNGNAANPAIANGGYRKKITKKSNKKTKKLKKEIKK